ncbi:putative alpha-l-rhamnosidase a [Diaporthe ampelina]|uniref:alpha-L-rhamnosidase n=1 Tax=Diaporthe ampelina TaxID=1214573 RepID=A0A0G2F6Q6_9PEZI|nr:putative alpha-l-rhamnosidase a [Diaporthe ampelina]
MAVSISALSFEHHRQPLGIAEARPRISWRFEGDAADWEQSGYDLEITRGPDGVPKLYNTVDSSESVLVPWPDEALSSAESAKVRVRSHGKEGQAGTDWSDYFSVETGLLNPEDWAGAVPIAAVRATEVDSAKRPVLFRKAFEVDAEVTSARLYITALGLYIAELNGERIGDHQLAPGYMSYQFRHTYDTYDVTGLLQRGTNAIGITIGEGFWAGRFGFNGRNIWGDTLGVQALLVVALKDGSTLTVKTDPNSGWHATAEGPIITSNIYDGEVYDYSKEIESWSTGTFDDSNWLEVKELPALEGRLTAPDGPPMRKLLELEPQSISTTQSGRTVIDFGQNLVGWLNITVSGPAETDADPEKYAPEFVPTNLVEVESGSYPRRPVAVWGDVIVGNPWAVYLTTGDLGMLEEQYEGARTWIDQGIPRNEVGLWNRSTFQYGDWLDPKAPESEPALATTHKYLIADAYLIQMTRLLSNISAALGKTAESEQYASDRLELVSAFHEAWIEPYDLIANVTQSALALGIRFDIFDSDTLPRAAETLNSIIANNSYLVGAFLVVSGGNGRNNNMGALGQFAAEWNHQWKRHDKLQPLCIR